MARQQVEQVKCDRCTRVELQPVSGEKKEPDFKAKFMDKEIAYSDICSFCRKTLERVWLDLSQWDRDLKQNFLGDGPAVPNDQAPPTVSPTSFVPPKPHHR